jgi:hypothetical protein
MSAGKKNDTGKPDVSLVPSGALLEEAYIWSEGKIKYSAYNWSEGILYSRILAAIGRHWALLNAGIDLDYETKRHHAAAIRAGCAMLIEFKLNDRTDLDDRMKRSEQNKALIESMSKGEYVWDLLRVST